MRALHTGCSTPGSHLKSAWGHASMLQTYCRSSAPRCSLVPIFFLPVPLICALSPALSCPHILGDRPPEYTPVPLWLKNENRVWASFSLTPLASHLTSCLSPSLTPFYRMSDVWDLLWCSRRSRICYAGKRHITSLPRPMAAHVSSCCFFVFFSKILRNKSADPSQMPAISAMRAGKAGGLLTASS
ncbi:hypothetical protein BJV78DRAFT_646886 [Lactifluus subvellereus]|nr:hypothetical protein BJV78DRAFT_646886 [Lactifluus subvellereus]